MYQETAILIATFVREAEKCEMHLTAESKEKVTTVIKAICDCMFAEVIVRERLNRNYPQRQLEPGERAALQTEMAYYEFFKNWRSRGWQGKGALSKEERHVYTGLHLSFLLDDGAFNEPSQLEFW